MYIYLAVELGLGLANVQLAAELALGLAYIQLAVLLVLGLVYIQLAVFVATPGPGLHSPTSIAIPKLGLLLFGSHSADSNASPRLFLYTVCSRASPGLYLI